MKYISFVNPSTSCKTDIINSNAGHGGGGGGGGNTISYIWKDIHKVTNSRTHAHNTLTVHVHRSEAWQEKP